LDGKQPKKKAFKRPARAQQLKSRPSDGFGCAFCCLRDQKIARLVTGFRAMRIATADNNSQITSNYAARQTIVTFALAYH
jgi:hypothetical protein